MNNQFHVLLPKADLHVETEQSCEWVLQPVSKQREQSLSLQVIQPLSLTDTLKNQIQPKLKYLGATVTTNQNVIYKEIKTK
jgi:hypothetical protein